VERRRSHPLDISRISVDAEDLRKECVDGPSIQQDVLETHDQHPRLVIVLEQGEPDQRRLLEVERLTSLGRQELLHINPSGTPLIQSDHPHRNVDAG
jgi:hypothetical protein